LYLPNLRHALYEHLIKSENILSGLQRGTQKYVELVVLDFDKDGREEVLLNNSYLGLYFSPDSGGSLFELDYKPKAFNVLNVLTRYKEPYHKEGDLFDEHRRVSFIDHCFPTDLDLLDFKNNAHLEVGDFVRARYDILPNRKMKEAGLTFVRKGELLFSGKKYPLKISKTFKLIAGQSILFVEYEITNLSTETLEFLYGMEFNLNLLACEAADRYFYFTGKEHPKEMLDSEGIVQRVKEFKLVDDWTGFSVSFEFSKEMALWRHPIETLSRSESGLEKIYQGAAVLPNWKIKLMPQQRWDLNLVLRLES
jgi:alpha-amylase